MYENTNKPLLKAPYGEHVIYPELSYQIVGILFTVYSELGPGYKEIYYERAIARELEETKLAYRRQLPYTLTYKGQKIGQLYFDFLIDGKIIIEIKKGDYFSRRSIHQTNEYLKATGLKLAILANFTSQGVVYRRIVNIN